MGLITRGLGNSNTIITQGFGGEGSPVPDVVDQTSPANYRWIEFARARTVQGTDPLSVASTMSVAVSLANGSAPAPVSQDEASPVIGVRAVPVSRTSVGNVTSNKLRALRRRR